MAYDDIPRKKIEIREDCLRYESHDELIEKGGDAGRCGVRTDVLAEGVGYLGMDDIDRIRRKNLKHRTR
jgi:hypothetical protein